MVSQWEFGKWLFHVLLRCDTAEICYRFAEQHFSAPGHPETPCTFLAVQEGYSGPIQHSQTMLVCSETSPNYSCNSPGLSKAFYVKKQSAELSTFIDGMLLQDLET